MTCCYYPSWKHSHIAVARYPPLEILDVSSLHVIAEVCVVTTSSGPLIPPVASSPKQRNAPGTPPPNPPRKILLWPVVCTSNSFLTISCMLRTHIWQHPRRGRYKRRCPFWHVPETRSCTGMSRRMQAFYAMNLPCSLTSRTLKSFISLCIYRMCDYLDTHLTNSTCTTHWA